MIVTVSLQSIWTLREDLAISMMIQQYTPYAYFQTLPIAPVGLVEEMVTTFAG